MKKLLFVFILPAALCLLPTCIFAQPAVEWESSFAKSSYDRLYGLCINPMGELLACGATWNDSNQT